MPASVVPKYHASCLHLIYTLCNKLSTTEGGLINLGNTLE